MYYRNIKHKGTQKNKQLALPTSQGVEKVSYSKGIEIYY